MTKKQKLEEIKNNSMEFKKWDNGKEGYIIIDKCNEEIKNILMKLIYDENIGGCSDLSYEIVACACGLFDDIETIKDLQEEGDSCEAELSSVYTAERLSYLNLNNQGEITDIMEEWGNGTDIQTACAIWYDNMVRSAYEDIKAFILQ